jgi:hypothetical protein
MIGMRFFPGVLRRTFPGACLGAVAVIVVGCALASPSRGEDVAPPMPPFRPYVDMKTFMEHVLTPAATIIWRVNGVVIDAKGEHDLSPKSDADWEEIVSGAATLAEATNALMIPQRAGDPQWIFYVQKLAEAANKAYVAAEARDLKSIAEVSDRLDGVCAACHRHYGLE